MDQQDLPVWAEMKPPSPVPTHQVVLAKSYRQAVRLAWDLKRVKLMTRAQLASEAELHPQHVSDYLAKDDRPRRRDLPAKQIKPFEYVVGNTLVSQWLAWQSGLTVLEEMQATRKAA